MSEFMSYDPWAEITTRNGYAGDEMVAMLQKAIRRGKEEDALHAAYEMYITSPQFEKKLWRRLLCISVEDIGFGNPDAPKDVYKRQGHGRAPCRAGDVVLHGAGAGRDQHHPALCAGSCLLYTSACGSPQLSKRPAPFQ